jgi:hypothetical protein
MQRSIRYAMVGLFYLVATGFQNQAAAQLSLSIDQLTPSITAGNTLDFTGVITNQTGGPLASTDMFFSFFNFDPATLNPEQVLGTTNFSLPNNTFSTDTLLFSVAVAPGASTATEPLAVTLEDVNGDVSNEVDLSINVKSTTSTSVPEPPPLSLFVAGLLVVSIAHARRRKSMKRDIRTSALAIQA